MTPYRTYGGQYSTSDNDTSFLPSFFAGWLYVRSETSNRVCVCGRVPPQQAATAAAATAAAAFAPRYTYLLTSTILNRFFPSRLQKYVTYFVCDPPSLQETYLSEKGKRCRREIDSIIAHIGWPLSDPPSHQWFVNPSIPLGRWSIGDFVSCSPRLFHILVFGNWFRASHIVIFLLSTQ